jgi:hypothetical protein
MILGFVCAMAVPVQRRSVRRNRIREVTELADWRGTAREDKKRGKKYFQKTKLFSNLLLRNWG